MKFFQQSQINKKEKALNLIRGKLKKSPSYFSELENESYEGLVEISNSNSELKNKANKMLKLIKQTNRLMDKY